MSQCEQNRAEGRLFSACKDGDLETVKRISKVVNVKSVQDGTLFSQSPLHYCCSSFTSNGHLNVVRYLVTEAHCDPNVKDNAGWTPLHYACQEGHLDVVKYLVTEAHCDPNIKSNTGWTILHYACQKGHYDVVRYLVTEAHCDPNVKNGSGWTPLHYACNYSRNGRLDVVRYLVTEGHCDPNIKDSGGWTPLHYACKYGHHDLAKCLVIEAHCDLNVSDNNECFPLHYACRYGHLDLVRYLVTEAHCDLNVKDNDGLTPLHYACKKGHLNVVRYLLTEAHCDPNVKNDIGWTHLHYACQNGCLDIVRCLMTEGHCDPNVKDNSECIPLHYASQYGHLDVVRYLVTKGNVHCKDNCRMTPVYYACNYEHLDVVRYLVNEWHCELDLKMKNRSGITALHYACKNGRLDVVRYLVTEGHCDPNLKDDGGWTPFHYACRNGYLDIVRCLVIGHCDPNIKDNIGWTPLHYACSGRHGDVVKYLVTEVHCDPIIDYNIKHSLHFVCRHGYLDVVTYLVNVAHCRPNIRNADGWAPLHSACKYGHLDIVRFLMAAVEHYDPNIQNNAGCTPLHYACWHGHLDVVKYLVTEAHCDPNIKDNNGLTPVHYACKSGWRYVVKYLVIEAPCDLNIKGDDGWTLLSYTCKYGHFDAVRYLMTESYFDLHIKDLTGLTLLHYACKDGNLDVVTYLVTETHCDPNVESNDGWTPLHYAVWYVHLDVVRYLVTETDCDPNIRDKNGLSPVLYAFKKGNFVIIRCLVIEARCDPYVKYSDGQTPLHYACRYDCLDEVKYLITDDPNVKNNNEMTPLHLACLYGHFDVVNYLVSEACCNPNVKDDDESTPLHYACIHGHPKVVRYLVTEAHCDPNVTDKLGLSAILYACKYGYHNIVIYLVAETHCDPNVKDIDGLTPLHYACKKGSIDTVDYLLKECHCDPNCKSENGATPLLVVTSLEKMFYHTKIIKLLLQCGAVASDLYRYQQYLPHGTPMEPAQSTVAVFMVGDKGAGKSTLTKALITEKEGISGWAAKRFKLGAVKEKTAGIECHTIHSSRIGSLTIYDLAGHREFHNSHDTVIRNSISGPASGMFLCVFDLRASLGDLKRTVSYWLAFIQNQVRIEASVHVSKPYVIAVGSHADSVRPKTDLEEKKMLLQKSCENANNVVFVGYVAVDCRYSESQSLTQLRTHMQDTHKKLQSAVPRMTCVAHCLHVYIISNCGSKPGMKLGDLVKVIKSDEKNSILPDTIESLHTTCSNLSKMGILLYIQRNSKESSWIVIDRDMLLREVNGSIFAPEDFSEYKHLTSTGVVPFSKICGEFKEKIDPQLIVDFLVHMEFCQEIREEDLLKLVTEARTKHSTDKHFLFPALTQPHPPSDVWQQHPTEYSSCWVLRCLDQQYFTPRFHQVLLLRLGFEHADALEHQNITPTSPVLHQQCSIWRSGIKWTTDSCDVLVEISDHSVVLLLSCRKEVNKKFKELELISTRATVISQILKAKSEFCGSTTTIEEFIPNSKYPVDCTQTPRISVGHIALAICRNKENIQTAPHTLVPILKVFQFEPYHFCNLQCLVDLYSEKLKSCKVTSHFIESMSTNISCVDNFCKVLNVPLHKVVVDSNKSSDQHKVARMFREWQSQSEGTYQCLRQHMDKYSVFSGRNIVKVANIPLDSLPGPSTQCKPYSLGMSVSLSVHDPFPQPTSQPSVSLHTPSSHHASRSTSPLGQAVSGNHSSHLSLSPEQLLPPHSSQAICLLVNDSVPSYQELPPHTSEGASLPVDGDTAEVKTKPLIEGLSLSEISPPSTGSSAAQREKPSLPKLLDLDIPEKVGAGYRKFGTFLLNDETGSLVDAIEIQSLGNPHRITLKILQDWVVGKGELPTWQTLVQTLRRCKLTILADQIQREYL